MAGNDDDGELGIGALDDRKHLETVKAAALEPDVENDELGPSLLNCSQGFVAVAGEPRAVAFVLQNAGDNVPDIGLVVDDQNISCH